jgi:hypothetical protein
MILNSWEFMIIELDEMKWDEMRWASSEQKPYMRIKTTIGLLNVEILYNWTIYWFRYTN